MSYPAPCGRELPSKSRAGALCELPASMAGEKAESLYGSARFSREGWGRGAGASEGSSQSRGGIIAGVTSFGAIHCELVSPVAVRQPAKSDSTLPHLNR